MTTREIEDRLLTEIDRETEPGRMSKPQALELSERLIVQLQGRCEALRKEIAETGEQ